MFQDVWPLRPGCSVDLARQRVDRDGQTESLTAREAEVLRYLLEREGQDVSIEELHSQVWGHGPEIVSRAAQNTLHRLKRKIERDASAPELLVTVHGVGIRLVREQDDEPQLVGRSALVTEVTRELQRSRVVTLSGLGGIGKTRVARAVHRRSGGLFVDLSGARDLEGLLRAVAGALGIVRATDAIPQLGRALAARGPSLVVLDNVEQIAAPTRQVLDAWLDRAPEARWLLTSRVRLGLGGEQVVDVPPLTREGAVQLFLERAVGEPGDATAIEALVTRLDGIPLAVELAAARTSVLDAAGIAARLDDALRLLARRGGGRQDAVATTLAWSWSLLDPVERGALAQCSVFRTPFRMEAAEAVVAVPDEAYLLDVLQALVDASLLHRVPGSPARLGMYAVVREFAERHLDDDAVDVRHARFFALHGSPRADLSDRGTRAAELAKLRDAELEDLFAAADAALARSDARAALDLARALTTSMVSRGPLLGARPWVEAALELGASDPDLAPRRAALRVHWASSLARAGQWDDVDRVRVEALADDPIPAARTQLHMTAALRSFFAGDLDAAEASLAAAMDGVGDDVGLHASLLTLGAHIALRRGAPVEARSQLQRALVLAEGRDSVLRGVHSTLGHALAALGEIDEALAHKERAVAIARAGADLHGLADALEGLGNTLVRLGRHDDAEAAFAEAAALFERLGQVRASLWLARGQLALERGLPSEARTHAARSARLAAEGGASLIEGMARAVEGRACAAAADPQAARVALVRALELLPPSEAKVRAEAEALLEELA